MKKVPFTTPNPSTFDKTTFTFEHAEKVEIETTMEYGNMEDWRLLLHTHGESKILEVIEWSAQMSKRNKEFSRLFLKSDFLKWPEEESNAK